MASRGHKRTVPDIGQENMMTAPSESSKKRKPRRNEPDVMQPVLDNGEQGGGKVQTTRKGKQKVTGASESLCGQQMSERVVQKNSHSTRRVECSTGMSFIHERACHLQTSLYVR